MFPMGPQMAAPIMTTFGTAVSDSPKGPAVSQTWKILQGKSVLGNVAAF